MKDWGNDETIQAIKRSQATGKKVVFTNGCFDILHEGHVRYLQEAQALGDVLVVAINTDDSVRRLKGHSRPIVPELERKEMLLALRCVDHVCVFDDDLPLNIIQRVRPDVLVKGGDWPIDQICGNEFVSSYGGKVLSLGFHKGHSTTNIVTKIEESAKSDSTDVSEQ